MNKFVLVFSLTASVLSLRAHGQTAQGVPYFTPGEPGELNVEWSRVPDRTYFLQFSLDMTRWHYSPCIEYGDVDVHPWSVSDDADGAIFFRLQYTDAPLTNEEEDPGLEDFDGDGINSEDEILGDTDPLNTDTDGDGLADSWELLADSDPTVAPPSVTIGATGLSVHSPHRHPLALRPSVP